MDKRHGHPSLTLLPSLPAYYLSWNKKFYYFNRSFCYVFHWQCNKEQEVWGWDQPTNTSWVRSTRKELILTWARNMEQVLVTNMTARPIFFKLWTVIPCKSNKSLTVVCKILKHCYWILDLQVLAIKFHITSVKALWLLLMQQLPLKKWHLSHVLEGVWLV